MLRHAAMSREAGPDLVDLNFRLATAAFIATSKIGEVLDAHDLTITNTRAAIAEFNLVFVKRPTHKVQKTLDRAARYFAAQNLPYRVCVRSDAAEPCRQLLLPRGFQEVRPLPGMRLSPPDAMPEPPADLAVHRVADPQTLAEFQATAFDGFGLPEAAAPLFLTRDFMELPRVALFVGRVGGEPVSTSALVGSEGVAGIYWVSTREAARGRGYGAALTWQAVRTGRDLGYPLASLQASEMGRPVYERMGFRHDRDYAQFDSPKGER